VGCGEKDCFLRFDGTGEPLLDVTVEIDLIDLTKSESVSKNSFTIPKLPPGSASIYWWEAPIPSNRSNFVMKISIIEADYSVYSSYIAILTTPYQMQLPKANVQVHVNGDSVVVVSDGLALFVTLTTTTPGYFKENVFMLGAGETVEISFVFAYPGDTLNNVQVMHMQAAMS